ncbi:hypothetical protein B7463_g12373, partial [Scytalidium lignicola]
MDIDSRNFQLHLLDILQDIAGARFVSIDLEMSGINTGFSNQGSGKQNLQGVYDRTRKGARVFQILQLGLTCVEEDLERGFYRAKPYNIYMSPLVSEIPKRYCQDRLFSFSSEACGFLLKNGLDFGKVFSRGVPYLSYLEENAVRLNLQEREKKCADIEDLVLENKVDVEFYENTRRDIQQWEREKAFANSFYNIRNPAGSLNGYQRRLVYQLVRKEFPSLEVFQGGHGAFLQLRRLDQESKANRQKEEEKRLNRQITDQKGLRFVFDALTGGDLEDIKPNWYCNKKSKTYEEDFKKIDFKIKRITQALKSKNHVIVGHNVFTDLLYLYNSFIGDLPLAVSDFKETIHELFPIVIDTRFLATYGMDSMTPGANLKDLLDSFKNVTIPTILLDDKHLSYNISTNKDHEAGFDAWMTAELFLKVSVKLYTDAIQRGQDADSSNDLALDNYRRTSKDGIFYNTAVDSPVTNIRPAFGIGTVGIMPDFPKTARATTRQPKPRDYAKTRRSNYLTGPDTDTPAVDKMDNKWPREDLPAAFYSMQLNRPRSRADDQSSNQKYTMIPHADSLFWKIYSNKLRVTASEEGILILDDGLV